MIFTSLNIFCPENEIPKSFVLIIIFKVCGLLLRRFFICNPKIQLNDLKFHRATSEMHSTVSEIIGKDRNDNKTNKY
jgi:hypothetical protein